MATPAALLQGMLLLLLQCLVEPAAPVCSRHVCSYEELHGHLCSASDAKWRSAAVQAAGQQVQQRAARELHVEPPFALACRVSAAARRQSLLVRSGSPDGAPTLGPEATVLPVGEPAVLSATLRVTAPCEVGVHRAEIQ